MNRSVTITLHLLSLLALPGILPAQVPSIWQSRGVGGGGALYSPSINPANDREFYVACDMSELFHTTDFGNEYTTVDATQIQAGHASAVRFTNDPLIAYTVSTPGATTPSRRKRSTVAPRGRFSLAIPSPKTRSTVFGPTGIIPIVSSSPAMTFSIFRRTAARVSARSTWRSTNPTAC